MTSLIWLTHFLSFASFLSCIFRILMLPIPGWSKQTLQKSEKSSARDRGERETCFVLKCWPSTSSSSSHFRRSVGAMKVSQVHNSIPSAAGGARGRLVMRGVIVGGIVLIFILHNMKQASVELWCSYSFFLRSHSIFNIQYLSALALCWILNNCLWHNILLWWPIFASCVVYHGHGSYYYPIKLPGVTFWSDYS